MSDKEYIRHTTPNENSILKSIEKREGNRYRALILCIWLPLPFLAWTGVTLLPDGALIATSTIVILAVILTIIAGFAFFGYEKSSDSESYPVYRYTGTFTCSSSGSARTNTYNMHFRLDDISLTFPAVWANRLTFGKSELTAEIAETPFAEVPLLLNDKESIDIEVSLGISKIIDFSVALVMIILLSGMFSVIFFFVQDISTNLRFSFYGFLTLFGGSVWALITMSKRNNKILAKVQSYYDENFPEPDIESDVEEVSDAQKERIAELFEE